MQRRRILALLCLFAIVALRIEPQLLQLPFIDRTSLVSALARLADGTWQQYPRFLQQVRARTREGDSITAIVPTMKWDDGYSYAYYRASYFLAGRQVLPLITSDDHFHPENFRAVRYVFVWRTPVDGRMGAVVWAGEGGVLLRH